MVLILGCGKDEPECIHPELYGDWSYHKHRIAVNENDILDTLSISDRYGTLTINKNGPSTYTHQFDPNVYTTDITIETNVILLDQLNIGVYEFDTISQDYVQFHCDCSGRFGDIDTDVFISFKLTQ